jgi:hypothetical protein
MLKELHFRVAFFALWIFALFMALTPKPPQLPIDRLGDKFEHILAFAVLAVFARLGFRDTHDRRIVERMSFAGALIEIAQSIPVLHRDCDWRDWVADTLAVALTLLIMRALPWRSLLPASGK